MPRLTVQSPWGPPVTHALEARAIVGRSGECDVVLHDASVSRRHLELAVDGARWQVTDLGSRHGTTLNGLPLSGTRVLAPGDVLALGHGGTTLVFDRIVAGAIDVGTDTCDAPRVRAATAQGLVGTSAAMERVRAEVAVVAASDATVLLLGENGSGKELVARTVHELSPRAAGPFAIVDCPSIPAELFESELFGVERGVATGVEPRAGRLESAEGGSVLLDEIGDLAPAGQAKLLRFLQDRTVSRVGARQARRLDLRVLAATNRDLAADVERGTFRRDLYHRLAVVTIAVPPLRERREDLAVLCEHVLDRAPGPRVTLSPEALDALRAHDWPGNVRELQAALERARLFAQSRGTIVPEDLPETIRVGRAAPVDGLPQAVAGAAAALARRLDAGEARFWDDVWTPFTRHELPRGVVRELLDHGLAASGGRLASLARRWGMSDPREYRRFVDFVRNNGLRAGRDGS